MRCVVITKAGPPSVLRIEERPDQAPGAGEVAIRVRASGINFADILARNGLYPDAPPLPCVVGYEVAGEIEAVGDGVSGFAKGDAVLALTRFNGYADRVVVPANQVYAKPEKLSFEEAAGIAVPYLTAYQLLVAAGGLSADESVLIHNAGSGVGLAAIDIAKRIGATTVGTSSPGKHDFLRERGLDHPIDYRNKDWTKEVDRITEGRGVELVTDPIGGAHWKKSYNALRSTGRLGIFGASSTMSSNLAGKLRLIQFLFSLPKFGVLGMLDKNRGVFGVNLGHMWGEVGKVGLWMKEILNGVDEGWVRPHVDSTFSLDDAAEAHAYIEARKSLGKVLLIP